MAETRNGHVFFMFLHLIIINLFLVLHNSSSAMAGPNGLTMKLIHRDSIESPLYPGNLTREERIQRLVEQSKARIQYLTSEKLGGYNNQTNLIDPDAASLPTIFEGQYYIALVGFGTFPTGYPDYLNYYLLVDSGSDLIWTQCMGCRNCFLQTEPYFPHQISTSYHPLPCNRHPRCDPNKCWGNACSYDATYGTGSTTKGILAKERLTVISDTGSPETIEDMVIGCGFDQLNFRPFHRPGVVNEITGILGIGRGPKSFLTQLGQRGGGRFSHCFQPWEYGIAPHTHLRFGEDAKIGGQGQVVQTTRMFSSPRFVLLYYLELEDLSIGDQRLHFPRGTFAFKRDGQGRPKGGCIIDSGSPWTALQRRIYDIFRGYVQAHFQNFPELTRFDPRFDLCYQRRLGFDNFPTITFHFHGADFVVDPHAAFYVTDVAFCLAFSPLKDDIVDAIIGARQMTNHRILYDVRNSQLLFAKEDCSIGS